MKCPNCGIEINKTTTASDMGKKGGSSKSEVKRASSRANVLKGGAPKKWEYWIFHKDEWQGPIINTGRGIQIKAKRFPGCKIYKLIDGKKVLQSL